MKFAAQDADRLLDLLRWRRDVRHFSRKALPIGTLGRLQRAMDLAPSVGNARPWRVLCVESAEKRDRVMAEFEICRLAAMETYSGEQAAAYARLKRSGLDEAPAQLAVFTESAPHAGHRLGRMTQSETLDQSTAMAVFSLWLAARAENIGVGMVSILRPATIEALFEVPSTWRFAAYLCVGYPAFDDDTPLLDRNGWQANAPSPWQSV